MPEEWILSLLPNATTCPLTEFWSAPQFTIIFLVHGCTPSAIHTLLPDDIFYHFSLWYSIVCNLVHMCNPLYSISPYNSNYIQLPINFTQFVLSLWQNSPSSHCTHYPPKNFHFKGYKNSLQVSNYPRWCFNVL